VLAGDIGAIERWRQALDATWSCPGCGKKSKR
jgi:rubredoxin